MVPHLPIGRRPPLPAGAAARRRAAALLAGLVLAAPTLTAAPELAAAPGPPRRPDLLFVTLDTTRADALGCYGNPAARTPVLDGLAATGLLYLSAWSAVPLTLPAHASLFTGRDPAEHGLRDNGWGRLDAGLPILAATLRAAGYRTAGFPASLVLDARFGLDRGFDLYDERLAAERLGQYGYAERPADAVVDAALAWLAAAPPDRPLFVWVHFYDPHAPYQPPPGLGGTTERQRYAGEVAFVDRELGRLLAGWPASRERLTAVVGDHGEAFGEHGEVGHGLLLYRPTLEVPLLLAGPGVPHAQRVTAPVASRRLAATLTALLGVPSQLPGPALPLKPAGEPAATIFHETMLPASAYGWSPLVALTRGDERAIVAPTATGSKTEVYALAGDPDEGRDLAADPAGLAGTRRELPRLLAAYLARYPPSAGAPPDAEAAAALRSLGYLSGQSGRLGSLHPRDGLALLGEFQQAGEQLALGRAGEARRRLSALVARSPASVPFLARLAAAEQADGDPTAALATLDRALALSPELEFLHQASGEALLALGRTTEAAAALRRSVALAPRAATTWLRLAESELRAGHPEAEQSILREALAAGAESAFVHARLAEIELARGDLTAADRHLAAATALLPEWAGGWRRWAEVARRQGRADLAAERERRAAERP